MPRGANEKERLRDTSRYCRVVLLSIASGSECKKFPCRVRRCSAGSSPSTAGWAQALVSVKYMNRVCCKGTCKAAHHEAELIEGEIEHGQMRQGAYSVGDASKLVVRRIEDSEAHEAREPVRQRFQAVIGHIQGGDIPCTL